MYEKILVPIDGSRRAERVLHHVEEIAAHHNSKVILLMATPLEGRKPSAHDADYYLTALERQKTSAEAYCKAIEIALGQKQIDVVRRIQFGDTIEAILTVAKEEQPDLIVIATHGKKATGKLLTKTQIPVLSISS